MTTVKPHQRRTKNGKICNVKSHFRERIPGGLASGKSPCAFDMKELHKGIKVEMEHVDKKYGDEAGEIAMEIAMDHLTEDPLYYRKLELLEKGALNHLVDRKKKVRVNWSYFELENNHKSHWYRDFDDEKSAYIWIKKLEKSSKQMVNKGIPTILSIGKINNLPAGTWIRFNKDKLKGVISGRS